ncbi:MAG: hypothetical protein RLZZ396_2335, partial [Planctomycetota bacterium]
MKLSKILDTLNLLINRVAGICNRTFARRARARRAFRRALVVEGLEGRRPLAFAITSSGTSITLLDTTAQGAEVIISIAPSGHFRHNLPLAGGLVSDIDTNGSLAGEQAILATSVTSITINAGIGNDTIDASAWTGAGISVFANAGNDVVKGGSGNDTLRGEAGDDIVEGNG